MAKKLKDLKWQSVALEGVQVADMNNKLQGFIGLEECVNYGSDKEIKIRGNKKELKRKAQTILTTSSINKKQRLSNGFIVEPCTKSKPSRTNENEPQKNKQKKSEKVRPDKKHIKEKIKDNIQLKPVEKKKEKPKLGENVIKKSERLSLADMMAWSNLGIPEEILKALAEQGFLKPTKIQELTLPSAMLGRRDILGAAETGSGKTLAFGIPILTGIMKLKERHAAGEDVYELPYKKSSLKHKQKKTEEEGQKKKKPVKKTKKKVEVSSEDGYGSESDDDDDANQNSDEELDDSKISEVNSDDDNVSVDNDSIKDDKEEFLEEYDVPIKKKKEAESDEGNDSDDSDNYVHLSELYDDDDENSDSDDETTDFVDDNADDEDAEGSDGSENTESQDEYGSADESEKGVGCVKVIDDVDLPGHVITKTGKPLYALILTPTRELAIQISRHLISAAKYTGIRIATVVGGMASVKQERVLSKGPEIVVATPGRLWELMRQRQTHLEQVDNIKFLAIDETDRMVERNHFEELHPLLERLNADESKKSSRQNFVFSATLTMVHDLPSHMKGKKVTKRGKILNRRIEKMTAQQKIKKLVNMIGMTDPKVVDITSNLGTAETLTECKISCSLEQKDHYLYYILKQHPGRTIVFCNSIGCVRRLAQLFGLLHCNPLPLHASMPQRQRLKNLERFRDDPHGVLIATDVAARGLDIPNVDHVIHYQVPRTAENYVHRSGRTARASKEGLTILMMEPGEAFLYTKLCRTLNKQTDLPSFPVPSHILNAMKEIVSLARDVDKLQLSQRKTTQEQGWLDKAAKDMDIIIDEDFLPTKQRDNPSNRALQAKKNHLEKLLSKPLFPRGYSFKYPTLNDPNALSMKSEDNALQVMKKALESGSLKKEKRKSKNEPLLRLDKIKKKFKKT